MIGAGAIGKVRLIDGEFSIGMPGVALEPDDPARRHWRFRLDQEGKAGLLGEAGSHTYHMASYITGLYAESVSALMATYAPRREVYDNAYITARFPGGVQGRFWYSYVAAGNDHGLTIKIFGETGSLVWWQEEGEILWHKPMGGPAVRHARGYDGLASEAKAVDPNRRRSSGRLSPRLCEPLSGLRAGHHGARPRPSPSAVPGAAADRRGRREGYGVHRSSYSFQRSGRRLGRLPRLIESAKR